MADKPRVAILHYSAAPVVGGVEAVMQAHARLFAGAGYPVVIAAGRGEQGAMPPGVRFIPIPEMDSQDPQIAALTQALNAGHVLEGFEGLAAQLLEQLEKALYGYDRIIVHNIFTKHFNLPLTAALARMVEVSPPGRWYAWCHDLSWTSPHSRSQVHPGYPWDLLRTALPGVTYVTISAERQAALAGLLGVDSKEVKVIYNGVDAAQVLGLSKEGQALCRRLNLLRSDLILLMPVRVTQAKNIELALRVVAALKERGCRVRLVITGPPDPHETGGEGYYRSLLNLREQLGVVDEARFVYETGPEPGRPYLIDPEMVGELYRLSDLVFLPSHREGFGIPILEAGLAGVAVLAADIPAAREIGREEVFTLTEDPQPDQVADRILDWARQDRTHRLKRRVRQEDTWEAIFQGKIEPLIGGEVSG